MCEKQKHPEIDKDAGSFANVYYEKLAKTFHEVDLVCEGNLSTFALKQHEVIYKDNECVSSMLMLTEANPFHVQTIPSMSLMQCWNCDNVPALLKECNYEVVACDFLAGGLPYQERCGILVQYIDLLLELLPECSALYWPHAHKLMPVEAFQTSSWNNKELHFLDGGLLVRFFHLEGSEDKLVDTIGLSAIWIARFASAFS